VTDGQILHVEEEEILFCLTTTAITALAYKRTMLVNNQYQHSSRWKRQIQVLCTEILIRAWNFCTWDLRGFDLWRFNLNMARQIIFDTRISTTSEIYTNFGCWVMGKQGTDKWTELLGVFIESQ